MAKNTITPFGAEVKKALKAKRMKQEDLAEKLGITKQYLYQILYGKKPGTNYLPMIADVCGINLERDTEDTNQTGEPCEENKEVGDMMETAKKEEEQMEPIQLTPFGDMVVEALERMGMKQVELAIEAGTSKQYLYMVLHGQRSGAKYIPAIARICEIDLQDTDAQGQGDN